LIKNCVALKLGGDFVFAGKIVKAHLLDEQAFQIGFPAFKGHSLSYNNPTGK